MLCLSPEFVVTSVSVGITVPTDLAATVGTTDLNPVEHALPSVFRFLDISGVFCNGVLGGRLAREKHFDAVGFVVLAILSALGGGVIRDVMLNAGPPIALTDRYYLIMALAGALVSWLWKLDGKWSRRGLLLFDALVLGTWAATGTAKALNLGFGVIPSILMGIITAVGGGMVRDIAAGNVPVVFGGNSLYAVPATVAAGCDALFFTLGYPMLGMLYATLVGSSFTIIASWRRWVLPEARVWTISMTHKQWNAFQRNKRRRTPPESPGNSLTPDSPVSD